MKKLFSCSCVTFSCFIFFEVKFAPLSGKVGRVFDLRHRARPDVVEPRQDGFEVARPVARLLLGVRSLVAGTGQLLVATVAFLSTVGAARVSPTVGCRRNLLAAAAGGLLRLDGSLRFDDGVDFLYGLPQCFNLHVDVVVVRCRRCWRR